MSTPRPKNDKIGQYSIVEVLAERDAIMVYRCHDIASGRATVVKTVAPGTKLRSAPATRIRTEARVRGAVNHPNVLPLYHAGTTAKLPYVVGPWLGGGALSDHVRRGRVCIDLLSQVVVALGSALDAVHAAGWAHGDVKMSNVILSQDGRPVLIDFSSARPLGARWLSNSGTAEMTPGVVAPEARRGAKLTAAIDIFALGALAFRGLTGRYPCSGDSGTMPPGQVDRPSLYSTAIGPHVDAAITRALLDDPAERYTSASACAAAISIAFERDGLVSVKSLTHELPHGREPTAATLALSPPPWAAQTSRVADTAATIRRFESNLSDSERRALASVLARALRFRSEARYQVAGLTAPLFGVASAVLALEASGAARAMALGAEDLGTIAAACGAAASRLERLLEVLAGTAFVSRREERYLLHPALAVLYRDAAELDTSATPLADSAAFWQSVAPWLQTGEPLSRMDQADGRSYASIVNSMGTHAAPIANQLVSTLYDLDIVPKGAHVLDVGAGSGVWSFAFGMRDPTSHITAVDRTSVLEVLLANARSAGLESQVTSLAGDWQNVALIDGTFDIAILANVCHLESRDTMFPLIRRVCRALRTDGTLVIVDTIPDDRREAPVAVRLQNLRQALRTDHGELHDLRSFRQWFSEAELQCAAPLRLHDASIEYTVLIGRRIRTGRQVRLISTTTQRAYDA